MKLVDVIIDEPSMVEAVAGTITSMRIAAGILGVDDPSPMEIAVWLRAIADRIEADL